MAEFVPFEQHVLVRIRPTTPDPAMLAEDFAALCVGYDPSGHGAYWLGQGYNRTRFNRVDGRQRVGKDETPQWEIVPAFRELLPRFETNRERTDREAAARLRESRAAKLAEAGRG